MAITNVISNSTNIFKDIIVRNSTQLNLSNLYLAYDGLNRPVLKIYDLPRGQQLKKSLLINHITTPSKLILISNSEDEKKEIVAYDKLCNDDLKTLTLTIEQVDGELTVTATQD